MIQSVKVKNLSLSKDNVRKSNRDADLDSLADNIAAHGLLQNLVVTPLKKAGHFTVKAGGRRLRALQLSFSGYDWTLRRRPISGSCVERIRLDSGKNTAGRLDAAWLISSVFRRHFLSAFTG